jgi:hypothetical protein
MSVSRLTFKACPIGMLSSVYDPTRQNGAISINTHDRIFSLGLRIGVTAGLTLRNELKQISFVSALTFKRPELKLVCDERVQGGHVILLPSIYQRFVQSENFPLVR